MDWGQHLLEMYPKATNTYTWYPSQATHNIFDYLSSQSDPESLIPDITGPYWSILSSGTGD